MSPIVLAFAGLTIAALLVRMLGRASEWALDLDTPLLKIGPNSTLTIRQIFEGIFIWGGIGSGKTSGSGKVIFEALLRAGFGGIVCIAKPDAIEECLNIAKRAGRSNSVILFDGSKGFNFLAHSLARDGADGLANVVETLIYILQVADRATGTTGQSQEPFWEQATRQWLNHIIPVLYSSYGPGGVTVGRILDFVTTAATNGALYADEQWVKANYAGQVLLRLAASPAVPLPPDVHDAMLAFWIREYPAIHDKTRSSILVTITARLDRLRHGRMRQMFGGKTDILPELCLSGAIIVLAMPILTWHADGGIGQMIFKHAFQRMVEGRNAMGRRQRERGVFIYADEAQHFANEYDDSFLATCRSARCAVVYLSQNIPTMFARFGRDKADAVEGLIYKFATQIFHLNSCFKTNTYASNLLGRGLQQRETVGRSEGTSTNRGMNLGDNENWGNSTNSGGSFGTSTGGFSSSHNSGTSSNSGGGANQGASVGRGANKGQSWSQAETMDSIVEPNFFASQLKQGGRKHGNRVTALWFRAGAHFEGGRNFLIATFKQGRS